MARTTDSPPDIATRALAGLLRDIVASGRKPIDAADITDEIAVFDLPWRSSAGAPFCV